VDRHTLTNRYAVTLVYDHTVITTTLFGVDETDARDSAVNLLAGDFLASIELLGMAREVNVERIKSW